MRCRAAVAGFSPSNARDARVAVITVDFGYTETPPAEFGVDRRISHFDAFAGA